ncbi:MAG: transposase [Chloroflexota bacterium]|nr:transposase [Chloroflexota bacterium]
MHAPQYHETLFSRLYPGSQHSSPTYIPVLQALDQYLGFRVDQRARTILRSDSGFGSDGNVNEALHQHWQVVTKGSGGRRPLAVARQIDPTAWQELRPDDRWVARVPEPPSYVRPVQVLALRWRTQRGEFKHSTIICSMLDWSLPEVIAHYDARGACETEIQADKGGLKLCRRRKKALPAQETLILLTDLAHNLLAWMAAWMFPDGPLAAFGPTQLIEDTLAIPGRLRFNHERLVEVQLNVRHPYAAHVAVGLERLLDHFGYP